MYPNTDKTLVSHNVILNFMTGRTFNITLI